MSSSAEHVVDAVGSGAAVGDVNGDAVALQPPGPVAVAIWASGLRCIATYVLVPALAPAVGAFAVLAIPLVLGLYGLSIATASFAAWRSANEHRWLVSGVALSLLALNVLGLVTVVGPRVVSA